MQVKVVNDNVHPYTEKFKGQVIHIPPKSSILMDHNDASQFLGTMPGNIQVDANGIQKPETYKQLRIEHVNGEQKAETAKKYVCMADGREFQSQKELDAYIEANHMDSMIDEKAKEQIVKRRGRPKGVTQHDASTD